MGKNNSLRCSDLFGRTVILYQGQMQIGGIDMPDPNGGADWLERLEKLCQNGHTENKKVLRAFLAYVKSE